MKNSKRNKILITVIIICLIILICGVGYLLFKNVFNQETPAVPVSTAESTAAYDSTESASQSDIYADTASEVTEKRETVENPIDFDTLTAQNSDVYSWIDVPDTNINYPVLQSDINDNLYLDHDVYKNYSFPGAIYSQSMNSILNGSMFANLYKFANYDFFNSHKYFYVYTADRKLTYEVVSAFEYDDRHIMNSFDFSNDEVFQEWLNTAQNPRTLYGNVNSEVKLDLNSKILVLSTCTNNGNGRFLLQGVMV